MKTSLLMLLFGLAVLCSCQKEIYFTQLEKEQINTVSLSVNNKVHLLQFQNQHLSTSTDTAILQIRAAAGEVEIQLQGISPKHDKGVGTYSLWCCANMVVDNSANKEYHAVKETYSLGTYGLQKGSCTIVSNDASGYKGSFVLYCKDQQGFEKTFSGDFIVAY